MRWFQKLALFYLAAMALVGYGFAIGAWKIFPYYRLEGILLELQTALEELSTGQLAEEALLDKPLAQLQRTGSPPFDGLQYTARERDDGFLLLAGLDRQTDQHSVRLIRLADGVVVHTWPLRYEALFDPARAEGKSYALVAKPRTRMQHPLLVEDGSLVFNVQQGPLVRIDACARPLWTNYDHFHHSIMRGDDGALWVPSVIDKEERATLPVSPICSRMTCREDALARVSLDGAVLEKQPLLRILEDNGYTALIYGVQTFDPDPLHLNSIVPALEDGRYWKKGDLLLSMRHLSAVALYRPSERRILWLKVGPWISQHDARFVGDSRISVFGNQMARSLNGPPEPEGVSSMFLYDPGTGEVRSPFEKVLREIGFFSPTEGRLRLLEDGSAFVEKAKWGPQYRISEQGVIWTYSNRYDDEHVGMTSWSRYYRPEEVREALAALAKVRCQEASR